MRAFVRGLVLATAVFAAGGASAASLVNGGFDDGSRFGRSKLFATVDSSNQLEQLPGWDVLTSATRVRTLLPPGSSDYHVVLAGGNAISQTVSELNVGRTYRLSFAWRTLVPWKQKEQLLVKLGDTERKFALSTSAAKPNALGWKVEQIEFVAASDEVLLKFETLLKKKIVDLNSVSVSQVPLPASAGLLVAGLGCLGALGTRRRSALHVAPSA